MLNKKTLMYTFIVLMFTFSFVLIDAEVQSLGTGKQNDCIQLPQICSTCTYNNISTIQFPDKSINNTEIVMEKNGVYYNHSFCSTNQIGIYIVSGHGDIDGTDNIWVYDFEITGNGKEITTAYSIVNFLLILFLFSLIVGFFLIRKKVDFENWHNSLIKKYQNRNYIKLVLGSMCYNVMKNSFVIYYLLGLTILLSITNIVYNFGIEYITNITKVFFGLYCIGIIIVGLYLFSNVQEWIMDLFNEVSELSWGVESND